MMEFLLQISYSIKYILKKSSIIVTCLGSKYASAFWRVFKRFISLKYFTL